DLPNYRWTETKEDLDIRIKFKVNFKIKSKDVVVEFKKTHLKAGLKGHPPIIDGETYNNIKIEDSTWSISDNELLIIIGKVDKMKWNRVLNKDPEIDTQTDDSEVGN
ncbi:hypothetical protein LOTGIDRAFT_133460, partial [Lottia gigantea]